MKINAEYIKNLSQGFYREDETEKRKLEVKSKWYDLRKNSEDKDEFCKDITAIANTPGPEGYIIIGVDEKNGTITHSPLSKCGLNDEALLHDIITKKVKPPPQFEVEQIKSHDKNKIVSLIKIPPSQEKPHVIGLYKNIQCFIPVRHGTKIVPANHADLEFMYYDRKNIEPDYRIGFLLIQRVLSFGGKSLDNDTVLHTTLNFLLQNTGRYPIAISSASLTFEPIHATNLIGQLKSKLRNWRAEIWRNLGEIPRGYTYALPNSPIIVPYNSLIELHVEFNSDELTLLKTNTEIFRKVRLDLRSLSHYSYTLILHSVNGITFTSDTIEVGP